MSSGLEPVPATGQGPTLPAEVDVLIAGGGPSGLFLAADLAQRGIESVVLEPRLELDWLHPRAKTTNARTMTHLRRLGLADELRAAAPLSPSYSDSVIFATSLVGHELTRFRGAFQLSAKRYEAQPESGQQVAQPVVEQVLRAAVQRSGAGRLELGASFVRANELPSGDGSRIESHLVDAAGAERRIRSRFLVGADGVSSTVRKGLGVRLEGSSAAKSNLGVLFRSEALAARVRIDPAVQYWLVGQMYAGMVGAMDLDGLWWAIVQGYDPAAPHFAGVASAEIVRSLIGAEVGAVVDIAVLAEDPWTARMLLSPTYRVGNMFLVGDAAHANPPWGGHGFNTCIGDAANLAWKLAAEIDGWAGSELLDSYQAERRPVARRTIDEAVANGTVLADDLMDPVLDAEGPAGDRARERAAESLQVKESEFHSLGLVLGYDYANSPLITSDGTSPPKPDPIRYEPSTVPGCLLPHVWLDEATSIYDLLGRGFTVLVDADAEVDRKAVSTALEAHADEVPVELRSVRRPDSSLSQLWQAPMLLVRPDQHVAWRGACVDELVPALRRAVGRPG
jgi:2-polyprenyl-6-methoxyphenol hydroxylase-like FAD-dependent oxidoreductase